MRDPEMRRWRALVRDRADRDWRELSLDVVDELACHLADLYANAVRSGASESDAERIALDALNAASFLEISKRPRARRGVGYASDVRVALRQLAAAPVVTAVAVLSLALGIGANTAVFSLVNSLMLRTLPVKDPQQLAIVTDERAIDNSSWTYPIWQDLRSRGLFENAFAWGEQRFDLAEGGVKDLAEGIWASAGMFDTLGLTPILGRGFTEDDDARGGGKDGPVAVISYGFWQRRYGGAASAVGRRLTVERVPFTIVGVLPPDFFGPDVGRRIDVAIPVGTEPLIRGVESRLDERLSWWLAVMVRLKRDQSIDRGTAALRALQPLIRDATRPSGWSQKELDEGYLNDRFLLAPAAAGASRLRSRYQRPLLTIMIVVAFVLLIACANIANLQLARATARRHEWSVRTALGASRWRLVRLMLSESLVMSIAGAGLGAVIARWASQLLVRQLSTQTDIVFLDLSIDWRVLAFTAAVTVATALLFGAAPAFRAASVAPIEAIKEQGHGPAEGGRLSTSGALVVVQVALSLLLVVAAALFLRTFQNLARVALGFDPDRVLVVAIDAQRAPIAPAQRIPAFQRARQAVASVPGIQSAALSYVTPVSGHLWRTQFEVSGGVALPDARRGAWRNQVSPEFFATYGQRLVAGRGFTDLDRDGAPLVAVVNEAFAREFLNGASPIGHTVRTPQRFGQAAGPQMEIVGVVGDAVYRNLRETAGPTVYTPVGQQTADFAMTAFNLNIRSAGGSPPQLSRSIADAVGGVDHNLALTFQPLSDQVSASLTRERVVAMLSGFFGGLALLLAGLGLYGVTSYTVSRRRTEIGIRMALGADAAGVVRLVLSRVSRLVGLGVLVGSIMSLWAGRFVSPLLFGLEPRDPLTLVASAGLLTAVAAFAGWLPAHRASRIDPARVLRDS